MEIIMTVYFTLLVLFCGYGIGRLIDQYVKGRVDEGVRKHRDEEHRNKPLGGTGV